MFEDMDNQVQEELDYILPDDYEEEAEETTEAETEESEVAEEGETAEESEQTKEAENSEVVEERLEDLEIKFLHETKALKDIPKDELKALVQKGMNHDRINEKLTQANESLSQLSDLATSYGMDLKGLIDTLFDNYFDQTAEREGITKEQVKAKYEQGKKNAEQKMYDRFIQSFPNVKGEQIPESVWQAVKDGEDLTSAYRNHLNDQQTNESKNTIKQLQTEIEALKNQLKTKEQNETVKKKAVVKATSNHGTDEFEGDEFLQGLLGS